MFSRRWNRIPRRYWLLNKTNGMARTQAPSLLLLLDAISVLRETSRILREDRDTYVAESHC